MQTMASSTFSNLTSLLLILLLTTTITNAYESTTKKNVLHLHFYFHEYFGITSTLVAQAPSGTSNTTFGNVAVIDCILRVGPNDTSALLGRAQGFDAAMLDDSVSIALNFVFTEGTYNGSTLALYGRVDTTFVAERAVIGGTGQFRGATGYAASKLVATPAPNYIVVQFDFYVKIDPDFMDEE